MVVSLTGSLLPALFPGSPAASKLAQQNAVLPSPLPSPEQQAQQRTSAILKFDRPSISQSTISSLTDSALRNATDRTGGGDATQRAVQAYADIQKSLRPVFALATPPAPVANPAALVQAADTGRGEPASARDKGRSEPAREGQGIRREASAGTVQDRSTAAEVRLSDQIPAPTSSRSQTLFTRSPASSSTVPGTRVDVGA